MYGPGGVIDVDDISHVPPLRGLFKFNIETFSYKIVSTDYLFSGIGIVV
jgi:hypothetical protein